MFVNTEKFISEIEKLRQISLMLKKASESNEEIVNQLNNISQKSREELYNKYRNSNGPVKSIRRKVSEILRDRNIDVASLENIIRQSKEEKPLSFQKLYNEWLNILYVFLLVDFRSEMYDAIKYISDSIIDTLNVKDEINAKAFDFTGERETGSTKCWIAFINKTHTNQATAKQLFLKIEGGEIEYSFYDRPNEIQKNKVILKNGEPFDFNNLIFTFQKSLDEILVDNYISQKKYWRIGTTDNNNNSYWEEMKNNDIISIGWSEIGNLGEAPSKKDVEARMKNVNYYTDNNMYSRKAGEILNFSSNIEPGDIVLAQKGSAVLGIGVVSGDYTFNEAFSFAHQRKIDWKVENPNLKNRVGNRTTVYQLTDPILINKINDILGSNINTSKEIYIKNKMKIPLNQILYGPPGTGKTHKLINEYFGFFTIENESISKETYLNDEISRLPWWKVIALTLIVSPETSSVPELKNHEFIKSRLKSSNSNSFDATLWGQLSQHTIMDSQTVNYSLRTEPFIFDKSTDSKWSLIDSAESIVPELYEIAKRLQEYNVINKKKKNYKFVTFHQSFNYEDFIEGIKPELENSDGSTNLRYKIEDGIFYECCDEACKLAGFISLKDCIENFSNEERLAKFAGSNSYALFIDEINRGNVSQIFGELITLIEENKRLTENEVIIELPYSKRKFSVPPNLYIIGTMNTADRSVEALDTALRRRFSFQEMSPQSELNELKYEAYGFSASDILKTINNRVELLLDRDHTFGHSFFILKDQEAPDEKLYYSFYENIIPLLQEYFFGDYGKLGLILGNGFINKKEFNVVGNKFFAKFNYENQSEFLDREIYEIIYYENDIEGKSKFKKAIEIMMNKTNENSDETK